MSEKIITKDKNKIEVKKPRMYKVIFLNDDYTSMEFVVNVLITIFHKSIVEANKIMLDVHKKGKGIVGIYTYDIAITKKAQVEYLAKEDGFPLKVLVEED